MDLVLIVVAVLAAPPTIQDIEFSRVQVEWIASTGTVHNLEDVLPRRQALLLRQLDCDHWECRELARDELASLETDALDTLCWGTRLKRPEVVQQSERLIDLLCVCDECGGTGVCSTCWGLAKFTCKAECDWSRRCMKCKGAIDLRYRRTAWGEIERIDVFTGRPTERRDDL